MAPRHPELGRELVHAGTAERARRDPAGGQPRETADRVHARITVRPTGDGSDGAAWRELGAAAQTGPEPTTLGRGGVREVPAVLGARLLGAADRPAVDAGGRDAGEEHAIESRV